MDKLSKYLGDLVQPKTAGDPVPGIDVAIEQIPGGSIQGGRWVMVRDSEEIRFDLRELPE